MRRRGFAALWSKAGFPILPGRIFLIMKRWWAWIFRWLLVLSKVVYRNGFRGWIRTSGKIWRCPCMIFLLLCKGQARQRVCWKMPTSSSCAGCIISSSGSSICSVKIPSRRFCTRETSAIMSWCFCLYCAMRAAILYFCSTTEIRIIRGWMRRMHILCRWPCRICRHFRGISVWRIFACSSNRSWSEAAFTADFRMSETAPMHGLRESLFWILQSRRPCGAVILIFIIIVIVR